MSARKCYRCQGPVESRDNIQNWAFLGGVVESVTEVVTSRHVQVMATMVSHRGRTPWPTRTAEAFHLCSPCWSDVVKFIGVGKRPEARRG